MFRYRMLTQPNLAAGDPGGDMTFGHGSRNFFIDNREATAQSIKTRLGLWTNEWWLDLSLGTAWDSIVGRTHAKATADLVIRDRILGTFGVRGISGWWSSVDPVTRLYAAGAVVDTIWGLLLTTAVGNEGTFELDVTPIGGGALG